MRYREKAIRFGVGTPLIGILTEPAAGTALNGCGVILFNAGLVHRIGPSRLHVQIARMLAPLGFVALRFDLSGVGDSEARRDGLAYEESSVLEAKDAMDYLAAAKGVKQFTLWGLCSGADAAFLAAVADQRVTGVVQLDAWVYPTWKYKLRHFAPKLINKTSWKNLLTGKTVIGPLLRRVLKRPERADTAVVDENVVVSHYAREFPPKETVEAKLRELLRREVRLLYIFSGGLEELNYGNQFRECFAALDLKDLVTVRYDRTADHIFSSLQHQRLVLDTTLAWITTR